LVTLLDGLSLVDYLFVLAPVSREFCKMTSCVPAQQQKDQEQLLKELASSGDEMDDPDDPDQEHHQLVEPTFSFSVCIQ